MVAQAVVILAGAAARSRRGWRDTLAPTRVLRLLSSRKRRPSIFSILDNRTRLTDPEAQLQQV